MSSTVTCDAQDVQINQLANMANDLVGKVESQG
jgi:hypothetical protein